MAPDRVPRASARRALLPVLVLVILAVGLRVAVITWRAQNDPLFHHPLNDAALYLEWAQHVVDGETFGPENAPYLMAPLYPWFVAGLLTIGGGSPWAITIVQSLLGVLVIVGLFEIGRRLWDLRAGIAAAGLALLAGPPLWFEGWFLSTTLDLFLLTATLMVTLLAQRPGRGLGWFVGVGLVVGLAALNRPQHLLIAAGLVAFLAWRARGEGSRRWKVPALTLLGVFVVVAPVTVRNLVHGGEFVPISSNGGVNFYLGNHFGADGRFGMPPDWPPRIEQQAPFARARASEIQGEPLDWSGASSYWFGRGMSEFGDQAGSLLLEKLRLVFAWREQENNFDATWVHRHLGPGRVLLPSIGVLWILALPALIEFVRRRDGDVVPLVIVLLATVAVCLLFWVGTRNRLPLLIPLALFAGATLAHLSWLKRPLGLGVAALALILVVWPTSDREGPAFLTDVARVHAQRGEPAEARRVFEEALAIDPQHLPALNGVALTYMEEGRTEQAIRMLEDIVRRYPGFELGRQNLERMRAIQRSER